MADNKVNFLRGTSAEYESKTKDNDTFYYTTDDEKLYLGGTEITGIEIDDTSTTATDKTWSAKKISDSIPTELPANGGNADTVDSKHASDFSQIISFGNTSTDTKTAIGVQYKTTTYWCSAWTDYPTGLQDGQGMIIAANYKNYGTSVGVDKIWCRQIFISPHSNTKIYQRIISDTNVGNWENLADGGNAATVNGYTVDANVPAGFSPNNMMSKTNPTGTGSFSLNRTAGTTIGAYSFAEGSETTASGNFSHAEGAETTASGSFSHAEGEGTTARADDSHAEGQGTLASGVFSHAEGQGTMASGSHSHVEGYKTIASGNCSHAEGGNYTSSGSEYSSRKITISEGEEYTISSSNAYGINSHAEGTQSFAYGYSSHAEGNRATAKGECSHAEGDQTEASGINSHAEGSSTTASGTKSHAEGAITTASGGYSHTEGYKTIASDNYSHAEGNGTKASSYASHAEGVYTIAGNYASHASGKYNAAMTTGGKINNTVGTAFVIGNGTASNALSNAFSVQYSGIVKAKSTITASTTADYAEFFEWLDGNPDDEDRVGYFVTLDGDKIRIATAADDYILGVVSGEPFVLGNGDCDTWNGMYLHDEFRRTIYEPAPKMIEILDSEGNPTGEYEEVEGEFEGTRPKLNPEYDHTKSYISRLDRKEWSPVGMLGVLAVRHDGTAQVNGYVTVSADGIATACEKSVENAYRVIKSNTDSVVEIIFR